MVSHRMTPTDTRRFSINPPPVVRNELELRVKWYFPWVWRSSSWLYWPAALVHWFSIGCGQVGVVSKDHESVPLPRVPASGMAILSSLNLIAREGHLLASME